MAILSKTFRCESTRTSKTYFLETVQASLQGLLDRVKLWKTEEKFQKTDPVPRHVRATTAAAGRSQRPERHPRSPAVDTASVNQHSRRLQDRPLLQGFIITKYQRSKPVTETRGL